MDKKSFDEITTETLSHFLKTPFSIILGFCELLLSGIAGELNKQQRYYLEKMKDQIITADEFLNDYLDRIEMLLNTDLEKNHSINLTEILKDIFLVLYSKCEIDCILPDFEIPSSDIYIESKDEIHKGLFILISEFKELLCDNQILKLKLTEDDHSICIKIHSSNYTYSKPVDSLEKSVIFRTLKKLFLSSNIELENTSEGLVLTYVKR
ncbi:MAG: hypothetical protein C0601_11385 [Candidatus Muiribacterium halophilum]|uniref:Signal transduction histidine kinase dimerisation/phosphoacceptor domain-containing protein n=1 Tax=Muiribacterium halophilum TaxID=2053465 RepID=A0A2N5ZC23_MUIH1|nr:MAG: hypothetical protein C0601_11385 [Candidatus Muirbacterium halophilum]